METLEHKMKYFWIANFLLYYIVLPKLANFEK